MSNINILLGVGGTGAKVVETALFCFFAGFGPDDVSLAFVDQDGGNGNVDRAKSLLRAIEQFRTLWWNDTRQDYLKPKPGETSLGAVRVRSVTPGDPLWCPHPAGSTLAQIFNAEAVGREDPHLKGLMDVLFAPDASEQRMELSLGYRGRAHIGSAAFLSRAEDAEPFWQALQDTLKRGQAGQEVRVFLTGSVFGGTGAAGFPTLARKLRKLAQGSDGAKIRIGGALMLPYFGFNRPEDAEANVARQEDLLLQSEEALRYYSDLFEREGRTFDELYLTGWNPLFQLGYHSAGAKSQANPPLPPELIAATSAVRFFSAPAAGRSEGGSIFLCSRRQATALGWADIPDDIPGPDGEQPADSSAAYQQLGRLLRFCTAWRHTIRPALKPRMFGGDAWYRKQGCGKVRYDHPQTIENLKALDEMVEAVLQWAAATQLFATSNQFGPAGVRDFKLWDVSPQAVFPDPIPPDRITQPVQLRSLEGSDRAAEAYNRVIWAASEDESPLSQSSMFNAINEQVRAGEHGGLGRLVDAVFHGAGVSGEAAR